MKAFKFCARASVLAIAMSTGAVAQTSPGRPDTSQPATSQVDDSPVANAASAETLRDRTGDIIITASRREQTLQNTPIAVSVTSAATIEQAQIRDLIDLQSVVPSLRVNQNQNSGSTTFTIRGFGNGANNPGIEPSVGVFIDGVYRSRSSAQITDLPNIQRVEVLRGPQSTLFGKNASAGVISVITQKPQFDFGGSASLTYGNFNQVVAKADITGPLSDTVAFSLAGNYNRRDGYYRIINLNNTDINDRDRYDVRGQLLFTPTTDLSIRLIGDYSRINELCCAGANIVAGPTAAALAAVIGGPAVVPGDPYSNTIRLNRAPENDIQNYGASGQIDYKAGNIALTSITAYRQLRSRTLDDSDFTQANIIEQAGRTRINTFTQEVRATSDFDGPLNFLVGGFYFNEKIDFSNVLVNGRDVRPYLNVLAGGGGANTLAPGTGGGGLNTVEQAILRLPAGTFFAPGTGIADQFDFKDEAYSFFGSVDFKPFERLTLTGGLNYTKDRKAVRSNVISTEPFSAVDLVAVGRAIGVPPALANTAANPLLPLQALQFLPRFQNFPNAVEDGRTRDSNVSYTLRAAFELNRNVNFYATYATGFKASSYNLSRDSRPTPADAVRIRAAGFAEPNLTTGTRFAGPENAKVYEIGAKVSTRYASVNVALFQQDIDGFQNNTFTGTGFALTNAGKQSTKGFEFDGNVTPVEPLNLFLSVTYLDAKYDSYVASAVGNVSGQLVAGVPPITVSTGATFAQPIGDTAKLILRGDYRFESETQIVQGLPGFITRVAGVPNYANAVAIGRQFKREVNEFNVSATLQLNDRFELSAYARNLNNNRYLQIIFDGVAQQGSVFGYRNTPRTYGGTVRVKF